MFEQVEVSNSMHNTHEATLLLARWEEPYCMSWGFRHLRTSSVPSTPVPFAAPSAAISSAGSCRELAFHTRRTAVSWSSALTNELNMGF